MLRQIRKNLLTMVGIGIILALVLIAVLCPIISPHNPNTVNMTNMLAGPCKAHLFGTDELGRDVLSRVLHGTRVSLVSASVVIAFCFPFGTILGTVAGYFGGGVDEIIMRITDVFLAVPSLILALAISAALGPSLQNALLALTLVWWPWYTRITRSVVLQVKEFDYVQVARTMGLSDFAILIKHVLPNSLGPAMVNASLDLGFVILSTASLSFIGLGAQPPQAEWGAMLSTAREYLREAWWTATFPGLAIFITVLGFNLLGDGLRDILDPRIRQV